MHGMVQKATTSPAQRGRPPSFDPSQVIGGAVQAFWENGFDGTSMDEVEQMTGANRSTIYGSFHGKSGLHRSAADAYVSMVEERLFDPLEAGDEGLKDIRELFDRLGDFLRSSTTPSGCFIVNDMASGPDRPAADRYLASLERSLTAALDRAGRSDEVDPSHAQGRVQTLVAAFVGINLVSRRTPDSPATRIMIDGICDVVGSWEVC
jgi:AcrR family transcriptional regulator